MICDSVTRLSFALALAALWLVVACGAKEQEISLPDDVDAVTIIGAGFQLRFEEIKKEFAQVQSESAKVEVPRPQPSDSDDQDTAEAAEQPADETVVTNENLYAESKAQGERDYGLVDDDLLEWIGARANLLMNNVERFNRESQTKRDAAQIIVNIKLLNTLVDLNNLNKEEIAKFRWVKNKLAKLLKEYVHEQAAAAEVLAYTRNLIDTNKVLELKVKGANDPGDAWMTNTQALRKILHEQRYSEALGNIIIEYLSGTFNMMKRSVVFQINRRAKRLNDGLQYYGPSN